MRPSPEETIPTRLVGQAIPRVDSLQKVTGSITYGADVNMPGMLFAKILQSPFPHAHIRSIDTSAALHMPGVHSIITAEDLPNRRGGRGFHDQWLLARGKVIYVGEPVAAVAADTELQAEEAAQAILVDYEELPAIFDPEKAMEPDAPLVHDDILSYGRSGQPSWSIPNTNILAHYKIRRGDVDQGFAQADYVFEDTFRSHYVHQAYMEPSTAVASVDTTGKATVWACDRIPHMSQNIICHWLDLPQHKVRIIPTAIGGSFGGKAVPRLEALGIVLSQKTRHPVKMVATRAEEFTIFGGRHATIFRIKTGVKRDGTITAREVRAVANTGAVEGSVTVAHRAAHFAFGVYRIPNMKADSYVVYTNQVGAASYRGVGSSQAIWSVERHTDLVASRLNMDPLEFRLKNIAEEGDAGPTGELYGPVPLRECLLKSAERIGWSKRHELPANRGLGLAISYEMTSPGSASTSIVRINPDGTVMVFNGGTDNGAGFTTVATQIAAEELNVALSEITIVCGDTDATPIDSGPSSSRQTFHVGESVRRAAEEAKRQLLDIAGERLQLDPKDLELTQGRILAREAPEVNISLKDAAAAYYQKRGAALTATGWFKNTGTRATMDPDTGQSPDSIAGFRAYGAEGVEVEVDTETGLVRVLQVVSTHHVGKAINPALAKGQLEGGAIMGMGAVLMEEVQFDQGRVSNPSFFEYRIPTIVETPQFECYLLEGLSDPRGPYGATGIGESTNCSVPPAVGNAVFAATGASVTETPITPERILTTLDNNKKQQARGNGS